MNQYPRQQQQNTEIEQETNTSNRTAQTSAKAKMRKMPNVEMHTVYLFIVGWTVTSSAITELHIAAGHSGKDVWSPGLLSTWRLHVA